MDKKALTLIEIILAVLILALVMLGFTQIFVSGKRHILHSRSRMTAAELGRYFLDNLAMQVNQSEWGSNCLGSNSCDAENQTITLNNILYSANYTTAAVAGTDLRMAGINITWDEILP